MKNRNTQLTGILFVIALALAPIVQAAPSPEGGPTRLTANDAPSPEGGPTRQTANDAPSPEGGPAHQSSTARANASSEADSAYSTSPEGENLPVITIHSTDNVIRGKTGSLVLNMNPALMLGGSYVNFSVSGTAISGVDYVALISPGYIGASGYSVIQIQTLPDPRGSSFRQAYSVVVTLKPGLGYAVGAPSSATMWIKP